MSVEATSWAFAQHTPGVSSGAKFLLVAICNACDKAGVTYQGREAMALDCACTTKTVSDNYARLEAAGLIARVQRRRRNGSRTSDYIIVAPRSQHRGHMISAHPDEYPAAVAELARRGSGEESLGEVLAPGQVKKRGGPDPLGDPSASQGVGAGASERTGLKINGKPVKSETWDRTVAALQEFNRQAGKALTEVAGTGEPSEAAKRIYGRLAAWPNLTPADIADAIRRTLASRWWGSDPPTVGVVFGPKVFEENLSRSDASNVVPHRRPDKRAARDEQRERWLAAAREGGLVE